MKENKIKGSSYERLYNVENFRVTSRELKHIMIVSRSFS